MTLTYDEFLAVLRSKPREFKLAAEFPELEGLHSKAICYRTMSNCVFLSVFYPFRDRGNDVRNESGQSMLDRIYAANDYTDGHDPGVRRDLEEACSV